MLFHPCSPPADRGFLFSNHAPNGAESRADNPAKTTVECPWVQDWESSRNPVSGVCSLFKARRSALIAFERRAHFLGERAGQPPTLCRCPQLRTRSSICTRSSTAERIVANDKVASAILVVCSNFGGVAQLVEQVLCKHQVAGANPVISTNLRNLLTGNFQHLMLISRSWLDTRRPLLETALVDATLKPYGTSTAKPYVRVRHQRTLTVAHWK